MDLAHNRMGFSDVAPAFAGPAASAGTALSEQLVREFLSSPELPRETLVSALQESLRRFESLLSCVSGTFCRREAIPPWKTDFISPGIETITGHPPEFFATTPLGDLVEPEDLPALNDTIDRAIARGDHFTASYRIRHKSGEIRWVSERGKAVYDPAGNPLFLEGFISDVTETRSLRTESCKNRQEILEPDSRLSRILENAPDAITTLDRNWTFTFANLKARRELQLDSDLVGRNAMEVYPEIRTTPAWQVMRRAMEEGTRERCEFFRPDLGKWFELLAAPDMDGIVVFLRDITRHKEMDEQFVNRANDLRTTLDSISFLVWSAKPDGNFDYFNKAWFEFLGLSRDARLPTGEELTRLVIHPDDHTENNRRWRQAIRAGAPFEMEFRLRHGSGEYRWVLGRVLPKRDRSGKIVRWYGTGTDIHERVQAERGLRESQLIQSGILDGSIDCIKIMDLDGILIEMNAPGLRAMAIDDRELVIGKSWADFWPGKGRLAARKAIRDARMGKVARFSGYCPTARNEPRWWDVIVSPMKDENGGIRQLLCISRNITEQRRAAERLRIASEQDSLTSLPNRRTFESHLKKVIAKASESNTKVGLMLLDLDYFKNVNDTLGHLAGDHLLRVLAKRLTASISDAGFVARLGGDEFAIVLQGPFEEEELVSGAAQLLSRIEEPVTYAGRLISGGASIGCALFPRDATDPHRLFRNADTALYDLKASGRGGIQMFSRHMMDAAERTADQLNVARRVIHEDAAEPFYQPKVRLDTGEVIGLEALLRWWSPGKGIQPPSSVAEAFNDYDLAAKIGSLMQRRVLADMAEWVKAGLQPPPVAINAAPAEFLRDDYAERLLEHIERSGISAALVEVEITEHVLLERRSSQVIRALQLLKQSGVRIALDDFGTGYSSLSYLRDFPVDAIKIDQSFISRIPTEPGMLAIVRAIAKLGPSLSLDIIAEGVETPEQLQLLREAGCGFGQGYLFGRAMDCREIATRLATADWALPCGSERGRRG